MNVFIYRHMRTGDPCRHGVWGIRDCMRSYRQCSYDAVLGIGGLTAMCRAIRKRITWIGIGVHRQEAPGKKGPLVTFDHVCLMNENGPMLFDVAPFLYGYVNEHNHRARIPLFVPVPGIGSGIEGELLSLVNQYSDCPPSEECDCPPDLICEPC